MFLNYPKKKAAIITDKEQIMFSGPTIYSKPIVRLEVGRLVKILKCENKWCKARSDKYKGWIKKNGLWGRI